jgi:hypothetical protein
MTRNNMADESRARSRTRTRRLARLLSASWWLVVVLPVPSQVASPRRQRRTDREHKPTRPTVRLPPPPPSPPPRSGARQKPRQQPQRGAPPVRASRRRPQAGAWRREHDRARTAPAPLPSATATTVCEPHLPQLAHRAKRAVMRHGARRRPHGQQTMEEAGAGVSRRPRNTPLAGAGRR